MHENERHQVTNSHQVGLQCVGKSNGVIGMTCAPTSYHFLVESFDCY